MNFKSTLVKQNELKDCGPACIATLVKYYHGYIPLENLKNMCHTTKKGTTALDIVLTLKKIGFKAQGFKTSLDKLNNSIIVFPCIVHVTLNNSYNHYIIIYKVDYKKEVLFVGDPKDGVKKMSFIHFEKIWNNIVINAFPIKKIPVIKMKEISLLKYILKTLRNYKKYLISIVSLSGIITLLVILLSFYLQYMIDGINNLKSLNYFVMGFGFFLSVFIIKITCDFLRNKFLIYLNNKIDLKMTNDIFKQIIYLPYHYYHNKTTGEVVARINDLSKVKQIISQFALSLFLDLPLTFLTLIVLIWLNQTLALIAIIIMLGYWCLIIYFKPNYEKYIDNLQKQNAEVNNYMIENIRAFETIKGLNIESNVIDYFKQKYFSLVNSNLKFSRYINLQYFFKEFLNNIGPLVIITVGCILILNQELTLGQLMSFNTLLTYFLWPLRNLVDLDTNYKEARNALKRINELLINLHFKSNNLRLKSGEIDFKHLNFSFNNRDLILKNINFKIMARHKVLLIGKSGSGKSTLCALLMKYYSVAKDKLFLDGYDINDLADVRDDIVYISQNELLFTDTLYNNIVLGRQIDSNEFLKVVKLCEIDKMSDDHLGYNELIEENGFNLSGGEKQRIFLARALLKNFSILIIDEGLNALDKASERRLLKKIFRIYNDKTIIIVSHCLVNKDLFDQVVKLKNGQLFNC